VEGGGIVKILAEARRAIMGKVLLILVVLLGAAAGFGWWWWKGRAEPAVEFVAGRRSDQLVATAERRDLKYDIEGSGDIEPLVSVDVKPEVTARIDEINFEIGDIVKQGEVLFRLDETDVLAEQASAESDVDGARLALAQKQRDFDRAQQLFERKLVSREIFEKSRTDQDVAKNSLEKAQRRLKISQDKVAKTVIHSPVDATALTRSVSVGQLVVGAVSVNSGTILAQLADLSQMQIKTHVNQVDVIKVRHGEEVTFTVDSLPGVELKGRVELIAPIATYKYNIKGFEVRVLITESDERLRPGMSANVKIPVAEVKGALTVPISAVFTEEDEQTVVYVESVGGAERREVEVGLSTFEFTEIRSGLVGGERVMLVKPAMIEERRRS
jgi:HlyD family secretion protein